MLAYFFPGQGSQHPGMGRRRWETSAAARAIFRTAESVLGRDYTKICFGNQVYRLSSTEYAQPAILVCSVAALADLQAHDLRPDIVAGHSVGEMAALVAAEVISFPTALLAVTYRGQLMQSAQPGAMSTVLGLPADQVGELCENATVGPVVVGLVNGPRNIVISGTAGAIGAVEEACLAAGAARAIRLPTERAFHSPLMEPLVDAWRRRVSTLAMQDPAVPVVLSTTGTEAQGTEIIRRATIDQFTHPVLWTRAIGSVRSAGARSMVEVGESKTLVSLNRMIDPTWRTTTTMDCPDISRLCRSVVASEVSARTDASPAVAGRHDGSGVRHAVS